MEVVAKKEKLTSAVIMEEVARGRLMMPANINHLNLEPMSIGIASRCKVMPILVLLLMQVISMKK